MKRHNCFCAFCRTPRHVPTTRHISLLTTAGVAAFSFFLMVVWWGGFDPRAIVVFITLLGLTEFLVQLRWRVSTKCTSCGFDPVLYLRSPETASERVQLHLQKIDESPSGFIKKPQLPTRTNLEKRLSGQNLSKQI